MDKAPRQGRHFTEAIETHQVLFHEELETLLRIRQRSARNTLAAFNYTPKLDLH